MQTYQRIFGTGPRGLLVSFLSLAVAWGMAMTIDLPPVHGDDAFGLGLFIAAIVLTLAGVVWSLRSLPVNSRGRELVTQGAFRYVRHPLYASFLLSFDFGLALYLDHWLYVLWAVAQLPLWSANVAGEERLMHEAFGAAYADYCEHTGRFIPKFT